MRIKTAYRLLFVLLLICSISGCTEPYILATNTYEEALVVEATIINEFKTQEITLTKTSRFEAPCGDCTTFTSNINHHFR